MTRLALAIALFLVPLSAHAQAGAARLAWVNAGLRRAPAVLIASDRVWTVETAPTSVCGPVYCRPVVRTEACEPPRCPGAGVVAVAAERIADVPDYPTDYDGFMAERAALSVVPELGAISGYLAYHPSPPAPPSPPVPARFSRDTNDWWRLEWELAAGIGTGLVHISAPMLHAQTSLGITFRVDYDGGDEGMDVIFGSQFGLAARAHLMTNVSGQRAEDLAVFVGVAPIFAYVNWGEPFRLPPAYSWLAPEIGVVVRTDGLADPSWYAAWSVPVTLLLDEHFGIEARASIFLIDDWYSGDDAEVLTTLDLGFVVR